jgi:putative ABC transport system permease protein
MTLPRGIAAFVRASVRRDLLEHALGDLQETFNRQIVSDGRRVARRSCWRDAVALAAAAPRWQREPYACAGHTHSKGDGLVRSIGHDVRYGWRALVKSPAYTVIAVATLALAIGANTVIFSFANVLVFRPLPIADSGRVAFVYSIDPHSQPRGRVSFGDYLDFRDRSSSFEELAASVEDNVTLTGRGEPQRLLARRVTPNLFDAWGLRPVAGRLLRAGEDDPGAACSVVLSDHLWSSMFQRNPSVVSTSIALDGRACTIVGVITPAIELGNMSLIDFWMPIAAESLTAARDARAFTVSGRMKPAVTVEQAAADLKAIAERLQREHPDTNAGWTARVLPTRTAMVGEHSLMIFSLMMIVVGFVLLIACANIANLVLARASARKRELAVRIALGATRAAVVRQQIVESLLVGAASGLCGIGVAEAALRGIRAAAYEPFFAMVVLDRQVLLFTLALSFAAPLLFSLLPALHAASAAFADGLREGSRSGTSPAARRTRSALVVAQVGLAMVLLVVAGLIVRTLVALNRQDLGFDPRPLLTAQIELPSWKFKADSDAAAFYERLADRLERLPEVRGSGAVTGLPTLTFGNRIQFDIAGRPAATAADRPWGHEFTATAGYMNAAGIRLTRGRWFSRADAGSAPAVAVVSAEAARRYWRSPGDVIGAHVTLGSQPGRSAEIIGIVGDVSNPFPNEPPLPTIYTPASQHPMRAAAVVLRAAWPEALAPALRAAIHDADADVPVFQLRTMAIALEDENSTANIMSALFISFAVLALLLASGGLYGVVSFAVGQRTQEMGVRIALGAVASDIRKLVFGEALSLVAIGGVLGLAAAALLAQMLSGVLFGVTPFDPLTYVSVAAVIVGSSIVAIWMPAQRAIRLDPVRTLRAE